MKSSSQLEQLRLAIHGVNAPFSCAGSFIPENTLALRLKDGTRFVVERADMFGTLVVCLPSLFWRGQLKLTQGGVVQKFDWGADISRQPQPSEIHWVGFFGDVEHQIEEVGSGARVTLTYLLRRADPSLPSRTLAAKDVAPAIQEAWRGLLADASFLPKGGLVGYPCCHLYHQDARFPVQQKPLNQQSMKMLKGRDQLVAAAALQAGLEVTFVPYLFENCIDETWQLESELHKRSFCSMAQR